MQVPNSFVPDVTQSPLGANPVQARPVQAMRNAAPEQMQEAGVATQRLGQELTDVAVRAQSEIDSAKIKSAESQFIENATDAQSKYLETSNADALTQFAPTQQAIVKAKQDILGSLDNDVQRKAFDELTKKHLAAIGAQMGQHQSQQRKSYSVTESAARADSMRTMAQNVPVGGKDQNTSVENGVAEVRNVMAAKGFPADSAETVKAERDYRTQIIGDNVNRLMVDGKYDDAKTLLGDQMKAGNVDPDVADHLRASIQSNVERVGAINTADQIFAAHKGSLQATDLESMLSKVNDQVTDPEQRDRVRSLVTSQFSQARSIQDAKYRDNLNDVVNFKYSNNGSLKGVDPVKWGMLDAKDRYDLTRPEAAESDINTWFNFVTNPDSLTVDGVKAAFAAGKLTKGDFRSLTEKAVSIQNKPDYVQEAGAIHERLNYFAGQSGLPVYEPSKSDEQKAQIGALHYKVQQDVDKIKAQNKGKITADQVDDVIKRELTKQTITTLRSAWDPRSFLLNQFTDSTEKFTFEAPDSGSVEQWGRDSNGNPVRIK